MASTFETKLRGSPQFLVLKKNLRKLKSRFEKSETSFTQLDQNQQSIVDHYNSRIKKISTKVKLIRADLVLSNNRIRILEEKLLSKDVIQKEAEETGDPISPLSAIVPQDLSEDVITDQELLEEHIYEDMPEVLTGNVDPEVVPKKMAEEVPEYSTDDVPQVFPEVVPEDLPSGTVPEDIDSETVPEDLPPKAVPEDLPSGTVPEVIASETIPEDINSGAGPEDVDSDAFPDDIDSVAVLEDIDSEADPEDLEANAVPEDLLSSETPPEDMVSAGDEIPKVSDPGDPPADESQASAGPKPVKIPKIDPKKFKNVKILCERIDLAKYNIAIPDQIKKNPKPGISPKRKSHIPSPKTTKNGKLNERGVSSVDSPEKAPETLEEDNLETELGKENESFPDNDLKPKICPVCELAFESHSDLQSHSKSHSLVFQCFLCDQAFSLQEQFKAHIREHAKPAKSLKCSKCDDSFAKESTLQRHISRRHPQPTKKSFECPTCEKSFKRSHHLKNHLLSHSGQRPFSCPTCKKSFARSNTLKEHMSSHSKPEGAFGCQFCPSNFIYRRSLLSHLKLKHPLELNPPRSFPCPEDDCGRRFTSQKQVYAHSRSHKRAGGFANLRCSVCNIKFSRPYGLQRHLRKKHPQVSPNAFIAEDNLGPEGQQDVSLSSEDPLSSPSQPHESGLEDQIQVHQSEQDDQLQKSPQDEFLMGTERRSGSRSRPLPRKYISDDSSTE